MSIKRLLQNSKIPQPCRRRRSYPDPGRFSIAASRGMRTQQKHRQGVWLDKALPDPAVSARSKSTDHVDLRILGNCIARIPRNTTPTLVETSDDTRDPRLSAAAESATSPHHPPATSRSSFPPQLSPFSDSHIAPGYHPFGPLRMSKNTQLRPLSSFGKNET